MLAKLRNPHIKSSEEEIAKALEGDYRDEHIFVLRQAYKASHFAQEQITECDRAVENRSVSGGSMSPFVSVVLLC